MGRRGPLSKGEKQGHGQVTRLEVHEGGRLPAPRPPARLTVAIREQWDAFWQSDEALAMTVANVPTVERLFELRDERRRLMNALRRGDMPRFVDGSKGQPRIAPNYEMVLKLEVAIGKIETELGLTPMARARLGLTVGQTQLTLDQLAERALVVDSDEPDPRIIDVTEAERFEKP